MPHLVALESRVEDIICTVPENCGEPDCKAQWHVAHYWIHADGEYTVCDADGNHEPCDGIPSAEQVRQAWQEYFCYVVETGFDPLHEFFLPVTKKNRQWQARIRNWIGSSI